MTNPNNVFETLRHIIADVVGVRVEEVQPTSQWDELCDEDSLDLLDLAVRCERAFGIRVDFSRLLETDAYIDDSGHWDQAALDRLRERYPHIDLKMTEAATGEANARDLLTVRNISALVRFSGL